MRGLTYTDGYLAKCIPVAEEWDGLTYYGGKPSNSSTEFKPVYGEGTNYPHKVSIEYVCRWLLRVRRASCDVSLSVDWVRGDPPLPAETIASSASFPITTGGYHCEFNDEPSVAYIDLTDSWGSLKEKKQVCLTPNFGGSFFVYGWGGEKPDYFFNPDQVFNYTVEDDFNAEILKYSRDSGWVMFNLTGNCYLNVVQNALGEFYLGVDFRFYGYDMEYLLWTSRRLQSPEYPPFETVSNETSIVLTLDDPSLPLTFPLSCIAKDLSYSYPINISSFSGSVTITPEKYWTYGGIYDEDTGERI